MTRFLFILCCLLPFGGFSKIVIHKNIAYRSSAEKDFNAKKNILDVYIPATATAPLAVMVFIHGGSWNTGNKSTYHFLGKGFASKNMIAVIINYRLTPEVNYAPMAGDCAAAVKWVYENISKYGGDSTKIFISGHSAGGHLAALISDDESYFEKLKIKNPIKGCVVIDGFGLDMYTYFPTSTYSRDAWFKQTFTNDPATWKKASPLYHVNSQTIPQLVWMGEKTYPGIKTQSKNYYQALVDSGIVAHFEIIKHKKHIGMIFQFNRRSNPYYQKILDFVRETN